MEVEHKIKELYPKVVAAIDRYVGLKSKTYKIVTESSDSDSLGWGLQDKDGLAQYVCLYTHEREGFIKVSVDLCDFSGQELDQIIWENLKLALPFRSTIDEQKQIVTLYWTKIDNISPEYLIWALEQHLTYSKLLHEHIAKRYHSCVAESISEAETSFVSKVKHRFPDIYNTVEQFAILSRTAYEVRTHTDEQIRISGWGLYGEDLTYLFWFYEDENGEIYIHLRSEICFYSDASIKLVLRDNLVSDFPFRLAITDEKVIASIFNSSVRRLDPEYLRWLLESQITYTKGKQKYLMKK